MNATTSPATSIIEYTRLAVRSWWSDGLWDLAMAFFFVITALWLYPIVRVEGFPSWTWSWPFITQEHINPLHNEIMLWELGIFGIWFAYVVIAYWIVVRLKRRFVAPRLGDIRHKFFLPVERKVYVFFLGVYLIGCLLLGVLYWYVKGGPHLFSVVCAAAPAGIIFIIGRIYALPRYQWVAVAGLGLSILTEMLTTNAIYDNGPVNFMNVSPLYGNPSLPLLIWGGLTLISGCLALRRTMRLPYVST
jgi:hypothetical protein